MLNRAGEGDNFHAGEACQQVMHDLRSALTTSDHRDSSPSSETAGSIRRMNSELWKTQGPISG